MRWVVTAGYRRYGWVSRTCAYTHTQVSGIVATVFGSTGFLGGYVVDALGKRGSQIVLPYRCPEESVMHLRLMGDLGQMVPLEFSLREDDESLRRLVRKSNVVINMLGRDYETRNFSFEDVHVTAARRIAEACKDEGVSRLVHLSANGASVDSESSWLRSKALGEAAVTEAFPSATIVRPTRLYGAEDRFLRTIAVTIKKLPLIPVIDGGAATMQPVEARDVALAIMEMLKEETRAEGKVYELAGKKVYTLKELVKIVYDTIREPDSSVPVPLALMKLLGMPREALLKKIPLPILSPSLFTLDEMVRLSMDDVPSGTELGMADLGIEPRSLEGVNLDYLRLYRQGGYDFGITAHESTTPAQR